MISRPPLPAFLSSIRVRKDQVRGRNRSPENIIPPWKSKLSDGRSIEYIAVVKLSALFYLPTYTVLEFLQKSIHLNTSQETVPDGLY